jgi:hypothetical protein
MAETVRTTNMLIKRNSMEAQGNTKAGPGKKPR